MVSPGAWAASPKIFAETSTSSARAGDVVDLEVTIEVDARVDGLSREVGRPLGEEGLRLLGLVAIDQRDLDLAAAGPARFAEAIDQRALASDGAGAGEGRPDVERDAGLAEGRREDPLLVAEADDAGADLGVALAEPGGGRPARRQTLPADRDAANDRRLRKEEVHADRAAEPDERPDPEREEEL